MRIQILHWVDPYDALPVGNRRILAPHEGKEMCVELAEGQGALLLEYGQVIGVLLEGTHRLLVGDADADPEMEFPTARHISASAELLFFRSCPGPFLDFEGGRARVALHDPLLFHSTFLDTGLDTSLDTGLGTGSHAGPSLSSGEFERILRTVLANAAWRAQRAGGERCDDPELVCARIEIACHSIGLRLEEVEIDYIDPGADPLADPGADHRQAVLA